MKSKTLNRRKFLKSIGLSATALSFLGLDCTKPQKSHPNIVYIIADDLGYGDVACLNPDCKIATPNIDRLAAKGIRFTDAHSGSAVCTPTRYGVLTGRYAWRTRLQNGVTWGYSKALIDKNRTTVASFLKKHGYTTGCVGKWHLGWNWALKDGLKSTEKYDVKHEDINFSKPISHSPKYLGFDYFFCIPASLDMVPYVYVENDRVLEPPTATIEGKEGYEFYRKGPIAPNLKLEEVLPTFTQKAIDFIERQADSDSNKPFFLYFPLSAPHTPILPTKDFQGKTGLGPYGDFVHQCDWTVGQVIKALEENSLFENTLFIFTSDNGCSPMANFDHLESQDHDPSYIFRGHKADVFEGGHRVPFIVRWPGNVKAGNECADPICHTDLLATTAEIVGEKLPENSGEDSVSFLPDLFGTTKEPVREAVIHHSINGSFSIRQGKWKLELCPGSGGWSEPVPAKTKELGLPLVQLYNLERDIEENENLQAQYPEVINRLTNLLEKYVSDGRSTPGIRQKNDVEVDIWKFLKLRKE